MKTIGRSLLGTLAMALAAVGLAVPSRADDRGTPQFHCALVVDGKVVVSNDGGKGVLCSLRIW